MGRSDDGIFDFFGYHQAYALDRAYPDRDISQIDQKLKLTAFDRGQIVGNLSGNECEDARDQCGGDLRTGQVVGPDPFRDEPDMPGVVPCSPDHIKKIGDERYDDHSPQFADTVFDHKRNQIDSPEKECVVEKHAERQYQLSLFETGKDFRCHQRKQSGNVRHKHQNVVTVYVYAVFTQKTGKENACRNIDQRRLDRYGQQHENPCPGGTVFEIEGFTKRDLFRFFTDAIHAKTYPEINYTHYTTDSKWETSKSLKKAIRNKKISRKLTQTLKCCIMAEKRVWWNWQTRKI